MYYGAQTIGWVVFNFFRDAIISETERDKAKVTVDHEQ